MNSTNVSPLGENISQKIYTLLKFLLKMNHSHSAIPILSELSKCILTRVAYHSCLNILENKTAINFIGRQRGWCLSECSLGAQKLFLLFFSSRPKGLMIYRAQEPTEVPKQSALG